MATPEQFAADCAAAAKGLRQVPKDLRRDLSQQVKAQIAVPLAGKVAGAARGPWSTVLAAGVKARAGADPTIVVGGLRPKLSGGAGPRQVIFGAEFGGGKRLSAVPAGRGRRGYRRYTTAQFRAHQTPFVFPTIADNIPWALDTWADLTLDVLEQAIPDG